MPLKDKGQEPKHGLLRIRVWIGCLQGAYEVRRTRQEARATDCSKRGGAA